MNTLDTVIADLTATPVPWPDAVTQRIVVVLGDNRAARDHTAAAVLLRLRDARPGASLVAAGDASDWPFVHPLALPRSWPDGPVIVWAPEAHDACVSTQSNSTRLVTTQALYVMQVWLDALDTRPDAVLVATADPAVLREHALEALERRGPWASVQFVEADPSRSGRAPSPDTRSALAEAFRSVAPEDRLAGAVRALDAGRTPPRLLALASVCMEVNDLENAATLLDEAAAAAPDWAAAAFEYGKLWLRRDDMARAAEAFGRASALMPAFASAAANWGATLGELDRPEQALAAFRRALGSDPANAQALNNVGVVTRELGRLDESESAFRRVIELTPDLAFGNYNLGHTLFLQGRYFASVAAYGAGQRKDPTRNPVQASRLALAKLAAGDAEGALQDLRACTANLPRDFRRQVLSDVHSVAWALLSTSPDLPGWRVVGDWLAAELGKP